MRLIALVLVLLSPLAACNDKKSSSAAPTNSAAAAAPTPAKVTVASCDTIKLESMCREYGPANVEAAGLDSLKGMCSGGEFKTEPCPKDKRVGSCATPEGTKVFYSSGGYPQPADKAAKSCAEGLPAGEWKAG